LEQAKESYRRVLQDLLVVVTTSILLIALWHLVATTFKKPYLPTPAQVLAELYGSLTGGVLVENTLITLRRVVTALLIALVLGLPSGLIASRTAVGRSLLRPIILATYPIPHVTLIPILFWILGVEWSKIAVIAIITYYPIALSTMEWATRVPREYEDLVKSMGGSRLHVIVYVVIPYIIPGLLTGLRIAVSTAYAVVFIAESFVLTGGLGAQIEYNWSRLDYPALYAYVITLSALGVLSYALIWALEKAYMRRLL
jgi:ABC-type nitrate/sulfonate/bicarbonate transport system permease component